INPDVTPQLHVVRRGIILCVVGVNVRIADVNRDVVAGGRQAVFICGLPGRSDFYWGILRSLDLSVHQPGSRKQAGEQKNQRSHGERQTYRSKVPLQSQKRSTGKIRDPILGRCSYLVRILVIRATSVASPATSFVLQQFDSPPIFFAALATCKLKRRHGGGRKIRKDSAHIRPRRHTRSSAGEREGDGEGS